MPHFIYFISSHGFGHAARSAAVVAAIGRAVPASRFTLMTAVPPWFFVTSLEEAGAEVRIEPVDVDPGLVQVDALKEDLGATVRELRRRKPLDGRRVDALARRVEALAGDLVLCDIAPLGIAVAKRCGLPSVLVENFTWDWIYRGYLDENPELGPLADDLEEVYRGAGRHVQTEPVCAPSPGALRVGPVYRAPRSGADEVRRSLGVPDGESLAVVTMGGAEWSYESLAAELGEGDPWLVIPGSRRCERRGRVIRIPHRSELYHPDLIHAADVVVAKLGYSTLAEVWSAGAPLAYLTRPRFPESAKLEEWTASRLENRRLEAADLESGAWLDAVRELLSAPRGERRPESEGAREIARFVEEARRARG